MVKTIRCDAIEIRIIATELDEQGRPVNEQVSAPTKVFRAKVPDIWLAVDEALAAMAKQQTQQPPPLSGPAGKKGKRR